MTTLFIILIIIASIILGLIVLIQNPKGGGLTGNVAGFSNNFMGVKQTTDVLEKGTWIFASIIGLLCLFSVFFISGSATSSSSATDAKVSNTPAQTLPQPTNNGTAPAPTTPK